MAKRTCFSRNDEVNFCDCQISQVGTTAPIPSTAIAVVCVFAGVATWPDRKPLEVATKIVSTEVAATEVIVAAIVVVKTSSDSRRQVTKRSLKLSAKARHAIETGTKTAAKVSSKITDIDILDSAS